ncbi:hypothetical protein OROHE_005541 [Orobanche hederae]
MIRLFAQGSGGESPPPPTPSNMSGGPARPIRLVDSDLYIRSSNFGERLQGNIGHDLYSEISQSSSIELDIGSTAVRANGNLHVAESDHSDWYDDESSYEDSVEKLNKANENLDREWRRRHNQFHTVGYRDGLIAGKETAAQEGFNIGFKDSVLTGYNLGLVRGITSAMACLPGLLKEKLVETEETRNKFGQLHESVQSLSTMDALKLFYEDGKRKLSDQQESPSISVLKNYHRLLQSLVSESPPLEGHLEVN